MVRMENVPGFTDNKFIISSSISTSVLTLLHHTIILQYLSVVYINTTIKVIIKMHYIANVLKV